MTWPPELERLRGAVEQEEGAAEAVGLLFAPNPRPSGYEATPAGALTFAWTGGDGVHFSLLAKGSRCPVLMTVPMCFDRPNVVVGDDLKDFLGLGLPRGFVALENLAYRPEDTTKALDAAVGADLTPLQRRTLDAIAVAFGAERWSQHGARLTLLAERHCDMLDP